MQTLPWIFRLATQKYKKSLNKDRQKEIYLNHYKKQRHELNDYKQTLKCFDCGYNKNCAILEFHHSIPIKSKNRNSNPRFLIKEHREGKTVCLCPNCHAERHFNPDIGMVDLNYVKL